MAWRRVALLVICLGVSYPLHFWSVNSSYFPLSAIWWGMVACLALALIFYALALLLTRERHRALWLALCMVVAFWSFDFFAQEWLAWLEESQPRDLSPAERRVAVAYLAALALYAVLVLYHAGKPWVGHPKGRVVVGSFITCLVAIPLAGVAWDKTRNEISWPEFFPVQHARPPNAGGKPDIYHIVLDAYGREDMLRDVYRYDNGPFIRFLEEKGFYVAHQSRSNFGHTLLCMSTAMNMDYIQNLVAENPRKPRSEQYWLKNNNVVGFLKSQGYRIIRIDPGWDPIEINGADVRLPKVASYLPTEFLASLMDDSPVKHALLFSSHQSAKRRKRAHHKENLARMVNDFFGLRHTGAQQHAQGINHSFRMLRSVTSYPGPKFVYAHFLTPHPPFVFDEKDTLDVYHPKSPGLYMSPTDMWVYTRGKKKIVKDYIRRYPRQVAYVNKQVTASVEKILSENPNSIILIHGDHGPGALYNASLAKSHLPERFSILNAYYFPDRRYGALYPSISPVNSYRAIFNAFFQTNYPLLEDKSYYGSLGKFKDITTRLKGGSDNVGFAALAHTAMEILAPAMGHLKNWFLSGQSREHRPAVNAAEQ